MYFYFLKNAGMNARTTRSLLDRQAHPLSGGVGHGFCTMVRSIYSCLRWLRIPLARETPAWMRPARFVRWECVLPDNVARSRRRWGNHLSSSVLVLSAHAPASVHPSPTSHSLLPLTSPLALSSLKKITTTSISSHVHLEARREECVPPSPISGSPLAHLSRWPPESSKDKDPGSSRSTTPMPSRPTTPRPPEGTFRSGMLTIRIFQGAWPHPTTPPLTHPRTFLPARRQHAASPSPRARRCRT